MKNYFVLYHYDINKFNKSAQELIDDGYIPYGDLIFGGTVYIQAFVKE